MKYLTIVIAVLLFACGPAKESTSENTDTTVIVPADTTTTASTTTSEPATLPQLLVSHVGDVVTASNGTRPMITFTLPDSTTRDFQYEGNGYVEAKWEPVGNLTFKSMGFSTREGGCSEYGDEGTSMMRIDTLTVSDDVQFFHSTFDNREAGTDGVQETYDYMYKGLCVRFEWTINWGYAASDEEKAREFEKIGEFLKSVRFENER